MNANQVSFKEINKIAVPAIIAGIAEPLISLTDLAIIGGVTKNPTESLAAVGLVGSFLSAIIWVLAQTKTAISTTVSQKLGSQQLRNIKTLVPQLLLFNFGLSIIIYSITYVLSVQIFRLYQADGILLEYAVSYYKIRALGFPFTLVTFALFGVFRGLQNTVWAMKISLIGGGINVVLTYVLVYGIPNIFEALHLQGAALASLFAQFFMFVLAMFTYVKKTPFGLALVRRLNPNLKGLLLMSGNLFIRTLSLNIAIYLANSYATGYGNNYIAAQSILMNIWLFFSFFIDGYAGAANAIGGKLLGQKSVQQLWNLTKDVIRYSLVLAFVLSLVCFVFYSSIGKIFKSEADVLAIFEQVFWIVLIMQPINAIAFVMDGIFKGLGEAKYLRNLLLISTLFVFVPILLIADYVDAKLMGVWIAFFGWMLSRSLLPFLHFRKKYRQAFV